MKLYVYIYICIYILMFSTCFPMPSFFLLYAISNVIVWVGNDLDGSFFLLTVWPMWSLFEHQLSSCNEHIPLNIKHNYEDHHDHASSKLASSLSSASSSCLLLLLKNIAICMDLYVHVDSRCVCGSVTQM